MRLIIAVATTREHLGYAVALRVPVFVVVTKADMCSPIQLDKTIRQVEHLLKLPGCNRIPARMEEENDVTTAASHFHTQRYGHTHSV
jgi:GTPase